MTRIFNVFTHLLMVFFFLAMRQNAIVLLLRDFFLCECNFVNGVRGSENIFSRTRLVLYRLPQNSKTYCRWWCVTEIISIPEHACCSFSCVQQFGSKIIWGHVVVDIKYKHERVHIYPLFCQLPLKII
jgi:hypothetical protein